MLLCRESILASKDIKTQEVEVPEWNGNVLVKSLSGSERDAYEASIIDIKGKDVQMNRKNVRAKLLVQCIVDKDLNPIFSAADVEILGKKSAAALDRVFTVAQKLSGISNNDLEELEKN